MPNTTPPSKPSRRTCLNCWWTSHVKSWWHSLRRRLELLGQLRTIEETLLCARILVVATMVPVLTRLPLTALQTLVEPPRLPSAGGGGRCCCITVHRRLSAPQGYVHG